MLQAPTQDRNTARIPPHKSLILNDRNLPNTGRLPFYICPQSLAARFWVEGFAHRKTHSNSIEHHPKAQTPNRSIARIPRHKSLILNDRKFPNTGRLPFYIRPRSPAPEAWWEVRAHLVLLTRFKFEQNIASRTNASRALKPTARCRVGGLAEGWSSAWNRWTPECNA